MGDWALLNDESTFAPFFYENFNGIRELVNRPGGADELVALYENFEKKGSTIQNRRAHINSQMPFLRVGFLELVLAHPAVLTKISGGNKNILKNYVDKLYQEKRNSPDAYGLSSLKRSLLIIAGLQQSQPILKNVQAITKLEKSIYEAGNISELDTLYQQIKETN